MRGEIVENVAEIGTDREDDHRTWSPGGLLVWFRAAHLGRLVKRGET